MYYAIVGLFMLVLPAVSIGIEIAYSPSQPIIPLIGKWYVFWAVGVRLGSAGLRQIIQPHYTAKVILGHKGDESQLVIRELGFANFAVGLAALTSISFAQWRLPIALIAGVFYLLAGGNHILQAHRNRLENVAMISDIFAALVLLSFFAFVITR